MSEGSVCIPNIGPRQRRQRVLGGVIGLVLGVAISALLLATGVARPYRAAVFLPFFVGMTGFFQAREKTCVALVAKKARNMDLGDEPVSDESEMQQLRAQAKKVYVQSLLSAALLSALVVMLP
ncbi:MAG TPA: hypothetical protein VK745_21555 [Polyangiaceae bacterium]|jgi:hypothetical protein|nr:hypothetical protein [Polyangiaceae bacterium]